jgi:hypothetical protein
MMDFLIKGMAALLLVLVAAPAFAINDDPTETLSGGDSAPAPQQPETLRGTPAPPAAAQVPAPQPAVVRVPTPVYTPPPVYYYVPARPVVIFHHHHFRH